MEQVILLVAAAVFLGALAVTTREEARLDRKKERILFENNRRVMLGADQSHELTTEDLYPSLAFFRMHNGGPLPEDSKEEIEFHPIGTREDYYL